MIDQAHSLSCTFASVDQTFLKRLGNYCIDSVNSWDNCPGEKSKKIQKIMGDSLLPILPIYRHVQHHVQLGDRELVCFLSFKLQRLHQHFFNLRSTCPLARCDMGSDDNGCWMGNWCQDMSLGEIYMQKTMFQKVLKKRTNLSLETFSLPHQLLVLNVSTHLN